MQIIENTIQKYRYVIKIAYDGMKYKGWQIQENASTVQEEIEKALSIALREKITIVGAGRTDTGVHATGQFAHFDSSKKLDFNIVHFINGILPYSISVLNIYKSIPEFHARFDATFRRYLYRICLKKNPFEIERALFVPYKLDMQKMQEASQQLLKFKNFASFCKANSDNKTYFCDIHFVEWKRNHDILEFHIQANRFLRGMVRGVVGTLLDVGKGKLSIPEFIEIIESQDRKNAKMNVLPYGLYLVDVGYPAGLLMELNHEEK